jgi:hypothetical protein
MRDPTLDFSKLIEIFNIETKDALEKYCRNFVLHQTDLVALIIAVQHGVLHPYRYANHFERRLPPHLFPNDAELEAMRNNGVGPFRSQSARKFTRKIFQLHKEQRASAAHLFYTPNFQYWYLFYFDNRDTSTHSNHWKHGSHIHLVSSLWPNLELDEVWKQVKSGEFTFPSKIHLRFSKRRVQ